MEKVNINTAMTPNGYSCTCDLLPGWIVGYSGSFDGFQDYVKESIDFYVECAKEDGRDYPSVFDGEYELVYKYDVQSLLEFYRGIFSFSALQTITGINQKQLAHYAAGISKPRQPQRIKIVNGLHRLASQLQAVAV